MVDMLRCPYWTPLLSLSRVEKSAGVEYPERPDVSRIDRFNGVLRVSDAFVFLDNTCRFISIQSTIQPGTLSMAQSLTSWMIAGPKINDEVLPAHGSHSGRAVTPNLKGCLSR